jgi:hypothetical protein
MTYEDFAKIYSEMVDLYRKDKELTHINMCFNIQPVKKEKKVAIINIKTFKDDTEK